MRSREVVGPSTLNTLGTPTRGAILVDAAERVGADYKVSNPDSLGNVAVSVRTASDAQYQQLWKTVQTLTRIGRDIEELGSRAGVENSLRRIYQAGKRGKVPTRP